MDLDILKELVDEVIQLSKRYGIVTPYTSYLVTEDQAVALPGLHRGSPTDPRFRAYSHQASPEKIGIAYEVSQALGGDFVVSDVSSNTVTILVTGGKSGEPSMHASSPPEQPTGPSTWMPSGASTGAST
jgi:hypothetical protein